MPKVQCKDEGHTGGRVDREDAILVNRKSGGSYRRASSYKPTLICLGCAADIYARAQRGEFKGQLSHSRWNITDLKHAFERGIREFAQRRGFEYGTAPVGEGGIHAPSDVEEGSPEDSERADIEEAMNPTRDEPEVARLKSLAYGGLVPRKPGEFHHHFTARSPMSKCTFCGKGVYEQCAGPQAEEWEARMQARRDLKDRIFHLAYGMSTEGHAEAADAMAEFNAETLRLFPDRFREPTPEELKRREEFQAMVDGLTDPAPRSYDVMPIAKLTPHEVGLKAMSERFFDTYPGLREWAARNVGIEITPEQAARMDDIAARATYVDTPEGGYTRFDPPLSFPELTEAQKEQAKGRLRRGPLPEGYSIIPLITGEPTSSAADLLRSIRASQGRELFEVPEPMRLHVVAPPLQQGTKWYSGGVAFDTKEEAIAHLGTKEVPPVDRTEEMQCELENCPATAILGNHQAHPHHTAQVIDNGPDAYSIHWWEPKTTPAEGIPQDVLDAQMAFYEHVAEEAQAKVPEAEATMGWIEATYNEARRKHEGGTIRDSHLAGLKAVWSSAQDVARADAYEENR